MFNKVKGKIASLFSRFQSQVSKKEIDTPSEQLILTILNLYENAIKQSLKTF
ncbi:hypothetical protein J3U66_06655 [Gilliamella sp. B2969]|uniref:hypothetical protein n=1 Tax=unclassified Gilliamella TaxID=2685620 RepID=UPI002269AF1D|nr:MULTISPECIES: hypothetical protein [unclassified Gilliamella]MCX8712803.1 hypothetical protein [Gilliamella sp. B3468]MCX8728348.1 hypothetical protein [Gilliamella sp. B2838]MCX8730057.1 hypothetical protein [Gilliamella sp. B2969]MCX8751906.1 hypothetical protein [Gilliamella sp. B3464]